MRVHCTVYLGKNLCAARGIIVASTCEPMDAHDPMSGFYPPPDWVKHAIFYQIFPDRFANGDLSNDPENVAAWGAMPTPGNKMGGDLRGIIDHLDYLVGLGISAIYLNPIFHASSNHKYNTTDYFRVDPHFGDLAAFHELIHQAHQRRIRVILDGVFNHCGRGFFAFTDVLENGASSPYVKWFHVSDWPLHPYDDTEPANYQGWWGLRSLPKFNTDHPPVRRFLLDVARYWIEQGADGWRLDVPNEIADHEFWREFRCVVKTAKPDAYIVGEIWQDATPWLDGTQFDGVMNYLFRDLCRDFFAKGILDAEAFGRGIERLLDLYPHDVTLAQLNLLGSHDTARFLTEANGDVTGLRLATLFQMTFPGAPCVYYGDEIGLAGGKDPYCRGCFPWDRNRWDAKLYDWFRRCIRIRREHSALRTGAFRTLLADANAPVYVFARWNEREHLVVALNRRPLECSLDIPLSGLAAPDQRPAFELLYGGQYVINAGMIAQVRIPARNGVVLCYEA